MHAAGGMAGAHLAVDFFFILSGFVMARTYEDRLRDKSLGTLRFLAKRYRRLWPTMAVGASMGLAVHLYALGPSSELAWAYAFAICLVPFGAVTPYMLNLPAWSIFYELIANALHGHWLAKMSDRALFVSLIIVVTAFMAAYMYDGFPRILELTSIETQLFIAIRAIMTYIIGILLARLAKDRSLPKIPFWAGAAALTGYIVFVSVYPFDFWPLPFILLIGPLAILAGLDPSAPKRISAVLGDISFPLYAVHMPIVQIILYLGYSPAVAIFASLAVAGLWLIRPPTKRRPVSIETRPPLRAS